MRDSFGHLRAGVIYAHTGYEVRYAFVNYFGRGDDELPFVELYGERWIQATLSICSTTSGVAIVLLVLLKPSRRGIGKIGYLW